jgi:two-component system, cell cycle response regulator
LLIAAQDTEKSELTHTASEDQAPMRVLAAEDNPVFQSMLRVLLTRWGYEAVIASDGIEAGAILEGPNAPRLAILDWMMPGMDGVDVCRRVRAAGREPYTYILLLSARNEAQDLVFGMDAGADDYVTKPFNPPELRVRLRAGQRILDLHEELLRAREALRYQAMHDALTGLLNRASVLEAFQREMARAVRARQPISVLMGDLDLFKRINDTYGHMAGDAVLREAAQRMKKIVRDYDLVGRYGGEEFLIVLPGCDGEEAVARAQDIRSAVSNEPFDVGSQAIPVTCSIGVAGRALPMMSEADTLLRESDAALYRAKAAGRNCVESALASAVG